MDEDDLRSSDREPRAMKITLIISLNTHGGIPGKRLNLTTQWSASVSRVRIAATYCSRVEAREKKAAEELSMRVQLCMTLSRNI